MIDATEIARGIYRIGVWDEDDLIKDGLVFPGATLNMFLIDSEKPTIIETLLRRTFRRVRDRVKSIVDPTKLRYVVVPHHEGDSSGAINEWVREAPEALVLCSDLCAGLSLRDFCEKVPRVVSDEETVDLGSHRLRFLMTPMVNQWDSLMVYEETTGTLFPNDLFSSLGTEIQSSADHSPRALSSARELGYQANDRRSLEKALDKIERLDVRVVATMHGPTVTAHVDRLIRTFRENSLDSE